MVGVGHLNVVFAQQTIWRRGLFPLRLHCRAPGGVGLRRWHSNEKNKAFIDSNLDQSSFCDVFSGLILRNLLILWSGRPGSNRRRPAWEKADSCI
jgi:hypothetical protein